MDSSNPSGDIAWDRVREKLPSTAHELLDQIQKAYEQDADDPARAIERVLRSQVAKLRERFEAASAGGES